MWYQFEFTGNSKDVFKVFWELKIKMKKILLVAEGPLVYIKSVW
jgi:hypothetical protein